MWISVYLIPKPLRINYCIKRTQPGPSRCWYLSSPPALLEVSSWEDPDLVTTKYLPRESPMAMDGGALALSHQEKEKQFPPRSFRPHTDQARQRQALKTCVTVPSARALHGHCRGYSCCLQCFTDEQPSSPRPAYTSSPATNQDQLLAHFRSASPTRICTTSGITEFTLPLPSSAEWHLWSSEQTNNVYSSQTLPNTLNHLLLTTTLIGINTSIWPSWLSLV